jgi:hypothetical protein
LTDSRKISSRCVERSSRRRLLQPRPGRPQGERVSSLWLPRSSSTLRTNRPPAILSSYYPPRCLLLFLTRQRRRRTKAVAQTTNNRPPAVPPPVELLLLLLLFSRHKVPLTSLKSSTARVGFGSAFRCRRPPPPKRRVHKQPPVPHTPQFTPPFKLPPTESPPGQGRQIVQSSPRGWGKSTYHCRAEQTPAPYALLENRLLRPIHPTHATDDCGGPITPPGVQRRSSPPHRSSGLGDDEPRVSVVASARGGSDGALLSWPQLDLVLPNEDRTMIVVSGHASYFCSSIPTHPHFLTPVLDHKSCYQSLSFPHARAPNCLSYRVRFLGVVVGLRHLGVTTVRHVGRSTPGMHRVSREEVFGGR